MPHRRVLIVEDEMIVQMHLQNIVKESGHDVVGLARTAAEALEAASKNAPELVLMDIHLADGSDGIDAAETLRERYGCAVVFATAYVSPETVARTEQIGAAGYIVKPFRSDQVRVAMSAALASHDQLRRHEERERSLTSILDNMPTGILAVDERGVVSFANPQAVRRVGQTETEAVGRDLFEVLEFANESDEQCFRRALEGCRATGRAHSLDDVELGPVGGPVCRVRLQIEPPIDGEPDPGGVVIVMRDLEPGRPNAPPSSRTDRTETRMLVYSHDTFGLGHLQRSLKIVRALVARDPRASVLLVTGSPAANLFELPKGVDYLKLPSVRKVGSEHYEPRSLQMPDAGIRNLRSNLLLRATRDFEPDVVLVDHAPLGMTGELLPALKWAKREGRCTTILGLRDIIDDPSAVKQLWEEQGVYDVLETLYDHIVVYGSRDVYDPVALYGFPADVAARTTFVDYVSDATAPDAACQEGQEPLVVVTIGGGDGAADVVIGTFLEMLERMGPDVGFRTEIVTGPLLESEAGQALTERARGLPVVLHRFLPDTGPLLERADVVVGTAGYNTTTDLLAHAKRAILIPRIMHRDEQLIRARRMHEIGLMTFLHPDDVTPESLFEEVRRLLDDAHEPLTEGRRENRISLVGADNMAEFCSRLLESSRLDCA